jgi:hypothetical protein
MSRVRVESTVVLPELVFVESVIPFLTFKDGNALRTTCKKFLVFTKVAPFCDTVWVGKYELGRWHKCFPMAKHVRLKKGDGYKPFRFPNLDSLFAEHQRGDYPKTLLTRPHSITKLVLMNFACLDDEFMALLSGIPVVKLKCICSPHNLTSIGFRHLVGVRELEVTSNGYFPHMQLIPELIGIRKLKLGFGNKLSDEMFSKFKCLCLEELTLGGSANEDFPLTDQAFFDIAGIATVELHCENHDFLLNISTEGFKSLGGQQSLEPFFFPDGSTGLKFHRVAGVDNSDSTWESARSN